jgi:3-oxoacyl-[acyl-carrier protein] reductase
MELTGKTALITGSTRGIGLAIAKNLASEGVRVALNGRGPLGNEIEAYSLVRDFRAMYIAADLKLPFDCERLVKEVINNFGSLDILINNSGFGIFPSSFDLSSRELVIASVNVNLIGLMLVTSNALASMTSGGHIINMSSMAAVKPFDGGAIYCASKAGVLAFSEALALELRSRGIKVTCIMPGTTDTFLGRQFGNPDTMLQPEEVAHIVIDILKTNGNTLISRVEIRPFQREKLL